ncbi:hypothetical protein B9Q11_02805 [Candidatus Marsarchaeota G2 archaeon ECH_B_SAG-F08]|jgi:hypoxanthine phosphoribosyltransferase|uniref:Phosphoribosyltransferase domain-containing protein n=3 Tax=Candidatus Marsarchaeota TaxID=1978152 RepID=A0A2R6AKE4_9ARCH|nr:MAG: hypothetical protein B9Q01_01045 [Candidatus Marsarchaeota G1 archaeon OSP_D]PSN86849.1 MAG: hypothetical protein B9Q02_00070 [Candidatus Marsarchaeota G1 archaeon BE_D]PSN98151.1 MAG: hypothetical protein B9Q11_02805 [Candidatus Marsarchaeota G2 archaeon ECH_B_SAG-F08]
MCGYLVPSWEEIFNGTLSISQKIRKKKEDFQVIVAIARGGWIPARIISDLLGITRLISIQVESYKGEERHSINMLDDVTILDDKKNQLLLVDDVSDTGSTLLYLKKKLEEKGQKHVRTVTLYVKPWTKYIPDYYYQITSDWVLFPWELTEFLLPVAKKNFDQASEMVKKNGLFPYILQYLQEILKNDS